VEHLLAVGGVGVVGGGFLAEGGEGEGEREGTARLGESCSEPKPRAALAVDEALSKR
jgi:hypothetical protein